MSPLDPDQLSTWQFDLPPDLIASRPAARRDDSRLLVVDRGQGSIQHSHIRELPAFLDPGDLLVFNNTQVLPARLFGFRTATNGRWEGLFVEASAHGEWNILCDTRGRLQPGETITVVRAYDQPGHGAESVSTQSGSPLLLTHKNTDWLEPNAVFWSSEIEFEMLRGGSAWKQFASTKDLISHLRMGQRAEGNALRIQIHQRFVRPLIDGTLLLLAIPVLLTRNDRHVFMVAGSCLMLVSGFTGIVLGLAALGGAGSLLDPFSAIWLPLIVFLPWGWMRTTQAMET